MALRSTLSSSLSRRFAFRRLRGFLDGVAPDALVGFPSGFVVKVSIQVPFVLLASHFVLSGSS